MTHSVRCIRAGMAALLLAGLIPADGAAQSGSVPLSPEAWIATDSIRFESYLRRPALYINRGVALVRGGAMENGTLELDVAATDATNFLGVAFRAASPRFSNVVFLRPGQGGTEEAVQYGPAFNSVGVAWQVYHGAGANAVATLPRNHFGGATGGRKSLIENFHRHGRVGVDDIVKLLGEAGLRIIESGPVGMRDLNFVLATA